MLSLVHLIYMAGDKCMRQNACYYKVSNHIWQLYTLGVGKFFCMLKFDLYEGHMIKNYFLKYTPPPPPTPPPPTPTPPPSS